MELRDPNDTSGTAIALNTFTVTMSIGRKPKTKGAGGNTYNFFDTQKFERTFSLSAALSVNTTSKSLMENLENAAKTWATIGDGKLYFQWGTKSDTTNKRYRVTIKSLRVVDDSREYGGTGDRFNVTLDLAEVGGTGNVASTSGSATGN